MALSATGVQVAVLLVAASLSACGASVQPVREPQTAPPIDVRIEASSDVNQGSVLHVLIRKTNDVDYPRAQYDDIAATLGLLSDPETVAWLVVVPGKDIDVSVARPEQGGLGVYFLFSEPGPRWKHFIAPTADHVVFKLSHNCAQVSRAEQPEGASGC